MNWKIFSIVCFVLILPVLGKWYLNSKDYGQTLMFSRDKKEIITIAKDDLFGNEAQKMEWKEGFWLGLMPPTNQFSLQLFFGVVPLGAVLSVLGVAGLFLNNRKQNKKV